MTRRRMLYISGILALLAFGVLVQQFIQTRRFFFQVEQVLHHEVISVILMALAIGIAVGSIIRD